jgi:hypothetical protein
MTPTAAGPFSFDMQIASDDTGENPYNAHIVGTAPAAGGGGDDGQDDGGCSTGTSKRPWLMLATLASLLAVGIRLRRAMLSLRA